MNNCELSIIVPVFNEAGNVAELIRRIDVSMRKSDINYELIFVDDRSTDNTISEIKRFEKTLPIIVHSKQGERSKALSIIEGSEIAKSDYIAMIDGDLQYPPEILPELYKIAQEKGVAIGNRQKRHSTKIRQFFSKANKFVFNNVLMGINSDVQSGVKVFKKEIISRLDKKNIKPWALDMPLLYTARELGYEIGSADIEFSERTKGSSKVNIFKVSKEVGITSLKLKLAKRKFYEIPPTGESMIGAGMIAKRKRYVTHTTLNHKNSAITTFSTWQKVAILGFIAIFISGFFINALLTFSILVGILTVIYVLDMCFNLFVLSKSINSTPEMKFNEEELNNLDDSKLPIYSILCPLYKEAAVLPAFIESIQKLDWPKNKLDVMLLLEENDTETIETAKNLNLPKHIRIVVVPHSFPKTKPKACNYGLSKAKGEYVVIYDAEDKPDILQLKKAYLGFNKSNSNVFCLQSKLNYYNPHQNFLTRLFTAEYSLWFDLTLPGLQAVEGVIPLGGTSNHFRKTDLMKLEGWDPFNVTEDCDLGVRLFRQGYTTAVIDSTTYEEANSSITNWIRQRSRWIKGYLQTYLVHTRKPLTLFKENGKHALVMQLVIGMRVVFILINPFLWVSTISYFAFYKYVGVAISSVFPTPIFYLAIISLIFGNFIAFYSYMIGLAKRGHWNLIKFVFLIPFYWIITSIASYMALQQLIFKPHYWEKTNHGLNLKDLVKDPSKLTVEEKKEDVKEVKGFAKSGILSGGFLIFASVIGNFFNFLYNAYLGRVTDPSIFGLIGLIGSFLYIAQIPTGGVARTVTYQSAQLFGKYNTVVKSYWKKVRKNFVGISLLVTLLWILLIPVLMNVFHSVSPIPFILFSPVWFIAFVGAVDTGFLTGNLFFYVLGTTVIVESITKFVVAYLFVTFGRSDLVYSALPISMFTTFVISYFVILVYKPKEKNIKLESKSINFSKKFYLTSFLAKVSAISFLSLDVILAKAYLQPNEAGKYVLLSLIGSMIFFSGSLFSQFITPIVSIAEGKNEDSKKTFHILLFITTIAAFLAFLVVGVFGNIVDVLLLGQKAYAILPYVTQYGVAMVFFTVVVNIVSYHQIKGHHIFPIISFIFALIQIGVTLIFHSSIHVFVNIMFGLASANLIVFLILNYTYVPFQIILNNLADFIGIFSNSPFAFLNRKQKDNNTFRILILNWRDTKHVWAGGAESYLHELAKRWVAEGNSVTFFCGNDGKNPRNEVVDKVQIVRRGGFYTVYLWAALYYIFRFRGKFDVIVDSENGLPFFTPVYSTVTKFLLIHHVHQEFFRENLKFPFNRMVMFIEKFVMPFVYRNQKIVTVSKSSKADVVNLIRSSEKNVDIVMPGIDIAKYKKTKKTQFPSFTYLGRLKPYKNIDTAIYAFQKVVKKHKNAKLFIAGDGESKWQLIKLVEKLNLSKSVEFLGKISDKDKVKLFGKAWVSIQPSSFEGWGITVIEANACATPVIASNVNGLKDSVVDGKTGLLVPVKNIEILAKAMEELIVDGAYRKQLSDNAFLWSKEFSWEESSRRFIEVIKRPEEVRAEILGMETI